MFKAGPPVNFLDEINLNSEEIYPTFNRLKAITLENSLNELN